MSAVLDFLSSWTFEPVPISGALVTSAAYLTGVRRVQRRRPSRGWPMRRTASFLIGIALLLLVTVGPIGAYDGDFFWAHMIQHIVMMMIATPLLLLGAPVLLLLMTASPATRRRVLVPILRSKTVHLLTSPALTWLLFAGTLIGVHFTSFFEYALTHERVHLYAEHPLYLTVSMLYFYPLIGANPVPNGPSPLTKAASLILQMAPDALTGFFIYSASSVLYPAYLDANNHFGPDPLADQRLGGALMWSSGMLINAAWIVFAVNAWLKSEARASRRIDRQIANERARAAP